VLVKASKEANATKARLEMSVYESVASGKSFIALAAGKVPAQALQIQDDLSPAKLDIPNNAPFLSGQLSADHQADLEQGDSYDCGSGKQYSYSNREGYVGGAVEMKLTGRPKDVFDDTLDSATTLAQKRVVHDSP
jgi:hypothetical protein